MKRIHWENLPPYEEGRYCPVVTVPAGPPQSFYVLGEMIVGVYTHWIDDLGNGGRSIPHLADRAACLGCRRFQRPRWVPYLACWYPEPARHVLVQLTRDAVRGCPLLDPRHEACLRGRILTAVRTGRAQTSSLRVTASEQQEDYHSWPIGVDECAVLCRLWGVERDGLVLGDEAA